jgi:hypothetical protein
MGHNLLACAHHWREARAAWTLALMSMTQQMGLKITVAVPQ